VWGEPTDQAVVDRTLAEDVPQVLEYLEAQAPAEGFLFGTFSIADVSIAVFFRNAAFAAFTIDVTRWPRTAALVERVLARDAFRRLAPFEERMLRTPLPQHRDVLRDMGAPIMAETYGTTAPRRGVMRI
jgi:glutathione S-transferase